MMGSTITQALLMGVLAFFNGLLWPLGWWPVREPVMSGLFVGCIYGDPIGGMVIGASISIAHLGFISAGGSNPTDIYWAGLLGTFVAMQSGLSPEEAVALAVPIGLLGNYVHITWMTVDSFWPNKMDKYAEQGDWKAIRRCQFFGGPLLVLLFRAVPVFLIALYGSQYIEIAINLIPEWAMTGLGAVGKVLPALGMSMLLKFMIKPNLIPFFIAGFAIAAFTGYTNLMLYVLVFGCIAYVMLKLGYEEKSGVCENE